MASYKDAVYAKCKDCCYDPLDRGTWRQQVEACTVKICPLWELRPKSTVEKEDEICLPS